MATNWNYTREEESNNRATEGYYRCSIEKVWEAKSQARNDMLVVSLAINGTETKVRDYFVQGEYFNRKITKFFDGFPDIEDGNFDYKAWIGKKGAVALKKDDSGYLKVRFYITPTDSAYKDLPEWVEETNDNGEPVIDDDSIPF